MEIIRKYGLLVIILSILTCVPSYAWLYDGGPAQYMGAMVAGGDSSNWVMAPFILKSESYATNFGAALSRAIGPADAGFNIYLTSDLGNIVNSALESWTVSPSSPTLSYYYFKPQNDIHLSANTAYFLVFMANNSAFSGAVSYSQQGYYGYSSGDNGQTWSRLMYPLAVRVDGSVVPEPSSVISPLAGIAALCFTRKRYCR